MKEFNSLGVEYGETFHLCAAFLVKILSCVHGNLSSYLLTFYLP